MDGDPIFLEGLSEEQLKSIIANYEIHRAIIDHYMSTPKQKPVQFKGTIYMMAQKLVN